MIKKLLLNLIVLLTLTTANSQTIADYNLLIVNGTFDTDVKTELEAMGHTATIVNSSALTVGYNYSNYDAIIFMYDSSQPASMSEILTLNTNNLLGIIVFRGQNIISSISLGTAITWSNLDFIVENNTHFITQPFSTGVLDLGFTYKSNLTTMSTGNTVLGSVGGNGSLVVNNTYRRVLSPYYGHTAEMPWTTDASLLMDRIIAWAADNNSLTTDTFTGTDKISVFPNPANELIKLNGLEETESFEIYTVLGTKIKSGEISNNEALNIQDLSSGLYFLKFKNGSTIKFIKK